MSDYIQQACEKIKQAGERRTSLRIQGGGTKAFLGRHVTGELLETGSNSGITDYEPSELVITARAGTRLSDLEARLQESGQMLPFEPPSFGVAATIGGTVAAGLSGPRRPYAGAVRDLVLGCGIINGFGEHLSFGGQVMKNVAGYDISRLMAGAHGTMGLITDISLKVLPVPISTMTLSFDCSQAQAIENMNQWAAQPLPVSATCHDGERLYVRLSGTETGVESATRRIGGDPENDTEFWLKVREQQHPFFRDAPALWRLSVPPASAPLALPGRVFLEWSGGVRWLVTDAPVGEVRQAAESAGGHAVWFRGHDGDNVFHPLDEAKLALHRNLKHAFDPSGVLNPGRMYAQI